MAPESHIKYAWSIVLLWFSISILIMAVIGEWGVVVFSLTYGILYGLLAHRYGGIIASALERRRLANYAGFILLAILVSVLEELYCYVLGANMAHPVLWIDLLLVVTVWGVWFSTWYFYLSRRYFFTGYEALLAAGATGVLFELLGNGAALANPLGAFVMTPLVIVIYAAIFALPMHLIPFTGENKGPWRYAVAVFLPFLLSVPAVVVLYIGLSLFGIG